MLCFSAGLQCMLLILNTGGLLKGVQDRIVYIWQAEEFSHLVLSRRSKVAVGSIYTIYFFDLGRI